MIEDPKAKAGNNSNKIAYKSILERTKEILATYEYGIDLEACLRDGSNFKVKADSGGVELQNYCVMGSKRGICADVAVQAALELSDEFKDQVVIRGAVGHCSTFDHGQHCYLLMWENSPENSDIEFKLKEGAPFPPGVTLVDPSEKVVYEEAQDSDYTFHETVKVTPDTFDTSVYLPYSLIGQKTSMQPIGFLRDIAPSLAIDAEDKSIVFIGFESDDGITRHLKLRVLNGTEVSKLSSSVVQKQLSEAPLGKFVRHIQKELADQ